MRSLFREPLLVEGPVWEPRVRNLSIAAGIKILNKTLNIIIVYLLTLI
jgi:hypothetical protein